MRISSIEQWQHFYTQGFRLLPIGIKQQVKAFDPMVILENIKENQEYYFIYESGKIGRYTFIGYDPDLIIKGKQNENIILERDGYQRKVIQDPLTALKEIMDNYKAPIVDNLPVFSGGAVGFFNYDMVNYFEKLPNLAKDDLKIPDLYFMVMDKLWIYDHQQSELYFTHYVKVEEEQDLDTIYIAKMAELEEKWNSVIFSGSKHQENYYMDNTEAASERKVTTSFTKEEFEQAVLKVQEYIADGDVFQVNLSIRQSRDLKTEGFDIYRHLRRINPSPYMGFIHYPDLQLVSSSPELLIQIENGIIQTRPIAGTRPRGSTDEEDQILVRELIENEKEMAEHIMLVDLERNDLGRVCKFGTVEVNELMAVEKYSHVMHIVSNVIGEMDEKYDLYDAIKATFPGGTITGAPKIRTMEIIEELEAVKRGPYTGSMGWIGFNNNLTLNILIRTLIVKDQQGHIQAGAGIVIDSVPEKEYYESLKKAEAVWRAVEASETEYMLKQHREE